MSLTKNAVYIEHALNYRREGRTREVSWISQLNGLKLQSKNLKSSV